MTKKFSLGIDLGTSNSCLSFAEVANGRARGIDITQVLGPGVIGEKPLLPSVLYLPASGEYAEGSLALPWNDAAAADAVVGAFARERAALVPDRVVTSAKSWLCNPHVDRRAPILPWQSDLAEAKVSPIEASRRFLAHLRNAAAEASRARGHRRTPDDCQIVLTVPASFDEVARTLTPRRRSPPVSARSRCWRSRRRRSTRGSRRRTGDGAGPTGRRRATSSSSATSAAAPPTSA